MADELDTTDLGKGLVVEDKDTPGLLKRLAGVGLAIATAMGVEMRKGSTGEPINLPSLQVKTSSGAGVFKPTYLAVMDVAKTLIALQAQAGATKLYLVNQNNEFKFVELDPQQCFDPDNVCECPPDFIAGFKEDDDGKLCLVRFTSSGESDSWIDTSSVNISGNGSSESPFNAVVKISSHPGNQLQLLSDGLYVGLPTS